MEVLEDRTLMATFVVNTTSDAAGVNGTLREAINMSNASPGHDRIEFNIPGSGPHVINVGSNILALRPELPAITDAVTIDGTTESDAVVLDGTFASSSISPRAGLRLLNTSGTTTVKALQIRNFSQLSGGGTGLVLGGAGAHVIESNEIRDNDVGVQVLSANNMIGGVAYVGFLRSLGNTVSGNDMGVLIRGAAATGNILQSNLIGGVNDDGNGVGVLIEDAANNTVRGTGLPRELAIPIGVSVISGNGQGVVIRGAAATGNVLTGNVIGTNAQGTAAMGFQALGVYIDGAASNVIGEPERGNLISGNGYGVFIANNGAENNRVQSNLIGTNGAVTEGNLKRNGGPPR